VPGGGPGDRDEVAVDRGRVRRDLRERRLQLGRRLQRVQAAEQGMVLALHRGQLGLDLRVGLAVGGRQDLADLVGDRVERGALGAVAAREGGGRVRRPAGLGAVVARAAAARRPA